MPFIAFLGCDGSGKSSVIQVVSKQLVAKGVPVTLCHWRPKPFDSNDNAGILTASVPHGTSPRGQLASIAKLLWLGLNWWIGWLRGLNTASRRGILIFDRYHGDLLVDPRRYRYGASLAVARLVTRFMPQPDLVLFLDASPDVLLARKQEVPREELVRSRHGYLELCKSCSRFRVIDAELPISKVIENVLAEISETSFR